eukprot:c30192_g1_i1 orf=262-411(-)
MDRFWNVMQVWPQHESAGSKLCTEVRDNNESLKKCDKRQVGFVEEELNL